MNLNISKYQVGDFLALLLGTLVKDLFLMASMILVERFSQLSTFGLRKEFYRRTLRMNLASFGEDRTANLLSRFTNDMNNVSQGISSLLGKAVREPLKMIVCLVGAALICWRLLLVSLIVLPVALYLIARLAMAIKQANRRAMEEMSQLYGVLDESFSGINAVKSFTMESYERSRFHRLSRLQIPPSTRQPWPDPFPILRKGPSGDTSLPGCGRPQSNLG